MDPRPGLNRREVPMDDGRVIVLRVYPLPPEIRDGIAAMLAEGERRERRQRRLDLARVVWLIAVLSMGLVAVVAVCLSK